MNKETYLKIKRLIENGPMCKDELEKNFFVMGKNIESLKKYQAQQHVAFMIISFVGGWIYSDLPFLSVLCALLFIVIYLFSYRRDKLFLDDLKISVQRLEELNVSTHPDESLNYTNLIMSDPIISAFHAKVMQQKRSPTVGEYHLLSTYNSSRCEYESFSINTLVTVPF